MTPLPFSIVYLQEIYSKVTSLALNPILMLDRVILAWLLKFNQ
jgi:hypothetical protein